nr:unnamed protein product [Callosobruchus analis]
MISLIVYPNGLRFINVYIYCKPPYQPKYQYLRKVLEPLKEIGYFEYTDDKNIVAMDVIKPNSLIILMMSLHAVKILFVNTLALADIHQLFLTAVIEPPTAEEPPGSSAVMELSTTAEESWDPSYHLFLTAVMEPSTAAEESSGSFGIL